MLDLDDLSRFIVTCQEDSLAEASRTLGIAPSSLSASLTALAAELGLKLFDRTGRGLAPTASAHWLFREALNVLHAERAARRIPHANVPVARPISVTVFPSVALGRLDRAIGHAMNRVAALAPDVCFRLEGPSQERDRETGSKTVPQVVLRYDIHPDAVAGPQREIVALDRLVLAQRSHDPGSRVDAPAAADRPILVPRIGGVSLRAIKERLDTTGLARRLDLAFVEDDPASLAVLLASGQDVTVLLPESALPARLLRRGVITRPTVPTVDLAIVAILRDRDAAGNAWVAAVREALVGADATLAMRPEITSRQFHFFGLLWRSLSVTEAARRAGVAQPAVTEQLGRLERTVAARLFVRTRAGLTPTDEGRRFESVATLLGKAQDGIALQRLSVGDQMNGLFELGILPSVGSDSFLVSRVAQAIEAWRQLHPGVRLRVVEQPNVVIRERVRRGTLRLGIITLRSPRMARVDLGSSEALALVFNRATALVAEGPVVFSALTQLPLVLPTAQFGLRQLIDAAARMRGVMLKPVLEVDSLAMCLALVRKGRLGTILPPSDVMQLVASGELASRMIENPRIVRTLQIVYSTARTLTDAERNLVKLLRSHLTASEKSIRE